MTRSSDVYQPLLGGRPVSSGVSINEVRYIEERLDSESHYVPVPLRFGLILCGLIEMLCLGLAQSYAYTTDVNDPSTFRKKLFTNIAFLEIAALATPWACFRICGRTTSAPLRLAKHVGAFGAAGLLAGCRMILAAVIFGNILDGQLSRGGGSDDDGMDDDETPPSNNGSQGDSDNGNPVGVIIWGAITLATATQLGSLLCSQGLNLSWVRSERVQAALHAVQAVHRQVVFAWLQISLGVFILVETVITGEAMKDISTRIMAELMCVCGLIGMIAYFGSTSLPTSSHRHAAGLVGVRFPIGSSSIMYVHSVLCAFLSCGFGYQTTMMANKNEDNAFDAYSMPPTTLERVVVLAPSAFAGAVTLLAGVFSVVAARAVLRCMVLMPPSSEMLRNDLSIGNDVEPTPPAYSDAPPPQTTSAEEQAMSQHATALMDAAENAMASMNSEDGMPPPYHEAVSE